jgi:hypothetical protein
MRPEIKKNAWFAASVLSSIAFLLSISFVLATIDMDMLIATFGSIIGVPLTLCSSFGIVMFTSEFYDVASKASVKIAA